MQEPAECVICYNPIDLYAVSRCGPSTHPASVCGVCVLRCRRLLDDKKCCVCMRECDQVVLTAEESAPGRPPDFHWFNIWGDDVHGSDMTFDKERGIFVHGPEAIAEVKALTGFGCNDCGAADCDDLAALQAHARTAHGGRSVCELCAKFSKRFMAELPLLTPSELKTHFV